MFAGIEKELRDRINQDDDAELVELPEPIVGISCYHQRFIRTTRRNGGRPWVSSFAACSPPSENSPLMRQYNLPVNLRYGAEQVLMVFRNPDKFGH